MDKYDRIEQIFAAGGIPEMECTKCQWVGTEDEYYEGLPAGPVPSNHPCPNCGTDSIRDYVSNLYKAGYR